MTETATHQILFMDDNKGEIISKQHLRGPENPVLSKEDIARIKVGIKDIIGDINKTCPFCMKTFPTEDEKTKCANSHKGVVIEEER